ncbi:ABC transporter permease [Amycolatopsis sp. FDAARGOS 1241]|uniref:ABC transporter permease n=1 Tax=Amycolatopsis sp. FDAARGOS 1241 TaxID=2778070 RepID=UPI00195285D6|nr:ABC transporter permease [Amycolatopsis sp. FDAARGOS 1241]QRP42865.1 ABC transporter permease [Amycolatopsis sp. FDAARGOS 1241]
MTRSEASDVTLPIPPAEVADAATDQLPRNGKKRPRVTLVLAVAWLGVVVFFALFAGLLPLASVATPVGDSGQLPGGGGQLLGTDGLGRSILSRLAFGGRISLAVGVIATLAGLTAGCLLGLVAAYFKGIVGTVVDILANTVLAIPPLVFLLAVAAAVRPSLSTLVFSLALLNLPTFARLAKANALSVMTRDYVLAAHAMGASHRRVLFREVLPGLIRPVAAYAVVVMATMIVAEGSLSFLGLGVPPPAPSWGGMIAEAKTDITIYPWPVFAPCLAIFLTVFALNVVGDRLQRRFALKESVL